MLSIDPIGVQADGRYGLQTDRVLQALRRYVLFSAGIATASLLVALFVSMAAILLSRANQSAASYYEEVASISSESPALTRALPDPEPEPEVPPVPDSEALPPAAPLLAQSRVVPDREIVNVKGRLNNVNITFYDCKNQGFCGAMYNGRKVYQGAAACSWNLAIGTKFFIVGDPTRRIYTCEDRGLLADTWVDVFWNSPRDGWWWQSKVGRKGTIEIVGLP